MTNGASDDNRLDRIEMALERLATGLEETKAIANSNSRAIQAMIEQQATDSLKREEEKAENERRIRLLEETQIDIARKSSGVVRLLAAMMKINQQSYVG